MKQARVTRDAKRDLDEIWLHVARHDMDAANRLVAHLTARFVLLGTHPEMGRARDELKPGLRSHPVDNYVIFYLNTRTRTSILHVLHGARDPKRVFKLTPR